jgi:hypothetical protein
VLAAAVSAALAPLAAAHSPECLRALRVNAACFIDGVVATGDELALVSDYTGRVLRIDASGAVTTLLDRRDTGAGCADLAWSPEHDPVIVPSLRSHTVEAFRIARSSP